METNLVGVSAEALTAHVDTVLADQTVAVTADTAKGERKGKKKERREVEREGDGKGGRKEKTSNTKKKVEMTGGKKKRKRKENKPLTGAGAKLAGAGVPNILVGHVDCPCCLERGERKKEEKKKVDVSGRSSRNPKSRRSF